MGYLLTNLRILDGTGREPFGGAVRVEGERIAEVMEHAAPGSLAHAGATVIDGAGATLMPGLVECHAHLGLADIASLDLNRLPIEEQMLITVRNARTLLDCGYTSAFSAAAPKPRLDVVMRREIEAGRQAGPRLLANGPEITVTGGLGDTNLMHLPRYETPTFSWVADGLGEIRRVCRLLAREGVDLLKLNLSGDLGTSSYPSQATPMTDGEVAAAMEVARAAGLRVAAHCRSAESVLMALRHGVEVIYHANYADERALDALEAARERVFVGPALGLTYNLSQGAGQFFFALALLEQQQLHAMTPCVRLHVVHKPLTEDFHLSRRHGASAVMLAEKVKHSAGRLQLRLVHVQVHAVQALQFQRDVLLDDFAHGSR